MLNNVSGSSSKVVDLAQLTTDIASGKLPQFMIIVPDGNHDAHDCPVGMSSCTEAQKLAAADDFLSGTLDPILSTPDFQPGGSGLIIVTFDECGGGTNSGCGAATVYTAVIGPQVAPHTVSQTTYKHENTLRTILDSLGVRTYPGAAASAADMSDFFAANGSKPEVTVSSPASGEVLSSPVVVQASAVPTSGHTVSGWTVYVDSASKYSTGAATAINPTLKISTGTHTILVRAWDTSGAFGDQTFSLTVNQEKPTVTVLTPASGANLGSPVNIQASASPTAGHSITGWWIYLDGTAISNFGSVTSIASNLTMGLGTHSVVVRAWDTSGAYGDQTLTLTASKKPAVVLSKPSAGTNVISPINIQASATPSSGHSITGWWIYLDGVASYQGGAVGSITANIRAATGQHTLLVRAWDSSGAYGDQTISVQVNAVAVNISNPANGASVTSPVNIMANALSPNTLTGWQIYVDSVPSFSQTNGTSVDANVEMNRGTHTVMVRAWDSTGAYGDDTINVTVP